MNPLLSREIRARFRTDSAFSLLLVLTAGLSLLFAYFYGQFIPENASERAAPSGQAIFTALSWLQTLGWLLVSPALTSSSIAYERERGWFDSLLLSPLSAGAIVLGKWASALLFAAILTLVTLPLMALLLLLLGGVSTRQLALMAILHAMCAMCGAAIGMATSAWSPRANTALRSAYGLIFVGLGASFYGAAAAGELPFRFFTPGGGNWGWTWLGRTNPILRAVEISGDLAFQRTGVCLLFLFAVTLICLAIATFYAARPLAEAPFIGKPAKKSKTASTHGEIPLFSRLRFANPVLDREVRAKFRMRQPPLAVVVVEILLAITVAVFYARTFFSALFDPTYRDLIFWGVYFTGLIVTMMAASIIGSNGIAREREGGTWEGVRLSLLSPLEIVGGKVGASLLTCVLFSLPVWPLLLPCVAWGVDDTRGRLISPGDLIACAAVWLATAWSYTLIGLWMGKTAARTARAAGQTLGMLTLWLILSPMFASVIYLDDMTPNRFWTETFLSATHPFTAINEAMFGRPDQTLRPILLFCACQGAFGIVVWTALHRALGREMRSAGEAEKNVKRD